MQATIYNLWFSIRHAAFAVAERISFASFLDGLPASTLSIDYRDQLDDVNVRNGVIQRLIVP